MKKNILYYLSDSPNMGGGIASSLTILKELDKKKFNPIVLIREKGAVSNLLDKLNITYKIFGSIKEKSSLQEYTKDLFRYAHFYKKENIHLVHFNCGGWRPFSVLAAIMFNIPIVNHMRIVIENSPFLKYSSLMIANSKFTANKSVPLLVPRKVVYNFTDINRFDNSVNIRSELNIGEEEIIILFLGSIKEIKGIDMFLNLAKSINDKNVRFVIVGKCADKINQEGHYTLQQLMNQISGNQKIKYIGWRSDVENIYKISDIIIMPSQWEEPFGLINIEAGAAKKPIISTSVGGIPEIINHGENGFLVEKDDLDSMIKYTKLLINNKGLRVKMGEKGRMIVEDKFNAKKNVREIEKIYESLIEKNDFYPSSWKI
ncbi:glycosyltransferase [Candidatus Woesearchaeota archaeon]|nr:glycosyltransferase [Candidatus Woesearchaeota archaeon]